MIRSAQHKMKRKFFKFASYSLVNHLHKTSEVNTTSTSWQVWLIGYYWSNGHLFVKVTRLGDARWTFWSLSQAVTCLTVPV